MTMNEAAKPSSQWIEPVVLAGTHVTLVPLVLDHVAGLQSSARDGELWRNWFTSIPRPEDTQAYVEFALAAQAAGAAAPFAVLDPNGEVAGTTRYCNIDAVNRRVEIGWTWYATRVQRSALNTEAKKLLLTHAFEVLGAAAVELRTNRMNMRSRRAIERIGAVQDGILRNHMRLPDGGYRDTVVYSIIESEWPAVKRHLRYLMERSA